MPLLVGLLDSAEARRSLDGSLTIRGPVQPGTIDDDIDVEAIAAKRLAGGNMLDSVANMANSILGAGDATYIPSNGSRSHRLCQVSLVCAMLIG